MENVFFYLTYYQVMTIIRLDEMKNENPYFHNEIASIFSDFNCRRFIIQVKNYSKLRSR